MTNTSLPDLNSQLPHASPIGFIGIGNMGVAHIDTIVSKKVNRVELTAICDTDPAKLKRYSNLECFADAKSLIRSGKVDAVGAAVTATKDHINSRMIN